MKLISNQKGPNHRKILNQLIQQSDEIIICVAFLKITGLNSILDSLKKKIGKCVFYIGTDYFLTEPNAIRKLNSQGHTVYRTKKSRSTFHSKVYYFKKAKSISILTGSANLTGGGLETNFEVSTLIETTTNSQIDRYFGEIISIYSINSIDFSDELLISQYENEYYKYWQKHKNADREFNKEIKKVEKFDLSKLPKFVAEYKADVSMTDEFKNRIKKYKKARSLLNEIIKVHISSPKEFLGYYDKIATSFYSSGLLRGKKTFAKKYETLISIFKIVQKNSNASAKILFEKTLSYVKSTKRYGVNAVTELMNTYNPYKYSVINGRTVKSLADLGFSEFPSPNSFKAEIYERYNNLIIAIATKCGFSNLGHVDHFLSWYYGKYVKKKT